MFSSFIQHYQDYRIDWCYESFKNDPICPFHKIKSDYMVQAQFLYRRYCNRFNDSFIVTLIWCWHLALVTQFPLGNDYYEMKCPYWCCWLDRLHLITPEQNCDPIFWNFFFFPQKWKKKYHFIYEICPRVIDKDDHFTRFIFRNLWNSIQFFIKNKEWSIGKKRRKQCCDSLGWNNGFQVIWSILLFSSAFVMLSWATIFFLFICLILPVHCS